MLNQIYLSNFFKLFLKKWFYLIFLLFVCNIYGQETTKLKLIVRALPDSILLRWAPDNFFGWNAGNKYGYNIVRFTLMKEGKMIPNAQPELLTPQPIKPWPLQMWDKIIDNDDYAGVAAQAIYGETFEFSMEKNASFFEIMSKVKEQDARFSYSLFAADQSPLAAKASGLWYTDKNVKKGEKYLYRVFLATQPQGIKSDTAFVFSGIDEFMPLPKPMELKAEFGDKGVILHWDRKTLNYFFSNYKVERSEDGVNFELVKKEPVVYAKSEDFKEASELMYIDSFMTNNKDFYYRVYGISPFGEKSPTSNVIKGKGIEDIKYIPEIVLEDEEQGKAHLKWTYPTMDEKNISGFKILRSVSFKSKYDTISKLLDANVREFFDKKPTPTNYYKVIVCKGYKFKSSVPALIQTVDSIPPGTPLGLIAKADTTGKVVLKWKKNQEMDIYGYRVYRANASNEEYSLLTNRPIKDTFLIDNISLKTLSRKIYYQVMALDKRQNHSAFSIPLELERPDIIPPLSPLVTDIKSSAKGIMITWVPSTSEDVVKHLILRKETGKSDFETLKQLNISDTSHIFIDSTAQTGIIYHYSFVAIDKAGLKSIPSKEIAGKRLASLNIELIDFNIKVDRENMNIQLSWDNKINDIEKVYIYKKEGNNSIVLYETVIKSNFFTDKNVRANQIYSYIIKIINKDGKSCMSKQKDIKF